LKIHQNNIFYFLKFILNINSSKHSGKKKKLMSCIKKIQLFLKNLKIKINNLWLNADVASQSARVMHTWDGCEFRPFSSSFFFFHTICCCMMCALWIWNTSYINISYGWNWNICFEFYFCISPWYLEKI